LLAVAAVAVLTEAEAVQVVLELHQNLPYLGDLPLQ
jgi:hypothetical protein